MATIKRTPALTGYGRASVIAERFGLDVEDVQKLKLGAEIDVENADEIVAAGLALIVSDDAEEKEIE